MARTRNLKPSFFQHPILGELPVLARLLFQGLWCEADREGRLEDKPRALKIRLLPFDDCDVDALLTLLSNTLDEDDEPFIVRYIVDGKRYVQITKFVGNQKIHPNESPSIIPPFTPSLDAKNTPMDNQGDPIGNLGDNQGDTVQPLGLISEPSCNSEPTRASGDGVRETGLVAKIQKKIDDWLIGQKSPSFTNPLVFTAPITAALSEAERQRPDLTSDEIEAIALDSASACLAKSKTNASYVRQVFLGKAVEFSREPRSRPAREPSEARNNRVVGNEDRKGGRLI